MRLVPRGSHAVLVVAALACTTVSSADKGAPGPAAKSARIEMDQAGLVASLVRKHGEASRVRAERGVRQVSAYWRADDGDAGALRAFVEDAFVADPQQLDALLGRFSAAFEQIDGHMLEIGRALRSWNELELGPQMGGDQAFAALDGPAPPPGDL